VKLDVFIADCQSVPPLLAAAHDISVPSDVNTVLADPLVKIAVAALAFP